MTGLAGLSSVVIPAIYNESNKKKQLQNVKNSFNKKYLYDLKNEDMEKFFKLKDGIQFYDVPSLEAAYYPYPEGEKPVAELPMDSQKRTNVFGLSVLGEAK